MWKHSYLVFRTCGALTNSPTGWIRALLIKQLFSQLQNLSRVSEDILWQIAPLPYAAKFSGCGQLDLIEETKAFRILLSVKLIFLRHFQLKCFYSSEEGEVDSCMTWYGWLQEFFSRCSAFPSLFWSSDLCFSVWLSRITRLNISVLFQPARDATHKMSFTDLNTVLLCLLVDVVNRWLVLKTFVRQCVFCSNKPVSSAQDLLDWSCVYKLATVFVFWRDLITPQLLLFFFNYVSMREQKPMRIPKKCS